MIAENRKFLVALVGAATSVAFYAAGHDWSQWGTSNWQELINVGLIPCMSAAAVWLVPNSPPS